MSKPIFAILRAVIALVIGFLLALNPETATCIIVVLIGTLFLLFGIVSVIYNIKAVKSIERFSEDRQLQFPITSVGCILFGLVLSLMPSAFLKISLFWQEHFRLFPSVCVPKTYTRPCRFTLFRLW